MFSFNKKKTQLSKPDSKLKSLSEIVRNIVETFAILIAGAWAIFTYILKDSPNLFQSTICETQILQVDSADRNLIHVEVSAKIKNSGKKIFTVDSLFLQYWLLPFDTAKKTSLFSPNEYINSHIPTFSKMDTSLSGVYYIDQEYSQSYNLFLNRDSTTMLIVRTFLFLSREKLFGEEKSYNSSYTFILHCIPDKKSTPN